MHSRCTARRLHRGLVTRINYTWTPTRYPIVQYRRIRSRARPDYRNCRGIAAEEENGVVRLGVHDRFSVITSAIGIIHHLICSDSHYAVYAVAVNETVNTTEFSLIGIFESCNLTDEICNNSVYTLWYIFYMMLIKIILNFYSRESGRGELYILW